MFHDKLISVITNSIDHILEYESSTFSARESNMSKEEAEQILAKFIKNWVFDEYDESDLEETLEQVREDNETNT